MAKSIRSKRERKLRAVKRQRYGAKELERLKKTIANDVLVKGVADYVTAKTKKPVKNDDKEKKEEPVDKMETNKDIVHKYNPKTMRNQFGNYPVWMNQRKQRQKKNKKASPKKQRDKRK